VAPQTPYGATPDGSLPGEFKCVLDPLDALTFVVGHTKTIALGTGVLDIGACRTCLPHWERSGNIAGLHGLSGATPGMRRSG
jgi:hypothetical protein